MADNKDPQILGGGEWTDMSSNELHVTLECPLCDKAYMKKVEYDKELTLCACNVSYRMSPSADGTVSIEMTLTREQKEAFEKRHRTN